MPEVTLQQLRAFVAVAQDEGFAPAARGEAAPTRTAMWQAIYRLEKTLEAALGTGVSLFAEGGRELSPAGSALLDPARAVLREVARVVPAVRDSVQTLPRVRVSCYPAQVPLALAAAALAWPHLDEPPLDLVGLGDVARSDRGHGLVEELLTGNTDIVMASQQAMLAHSSEEVVHEELYVWELVAVCSEGHPAYGASKVALAALAVEGRLAMSPPGHESRELLEPYLRETRYQGMATESVDALVALGRAGWAVALVPSDALPVQSVLADARPFPRVTVGARAETLCGTISASMRRTSHGQQDVGRYFEALLEVASEGGQA